MKLAPYPKYKPSGVKWLGEVPEHWEVKRLKGAATYWVSNVDKVAADDETPVRLCNYTDVYYHDQIRPEMGLMETTATTQEIHRFGLQVDDVLITKDSEDWSDIAVPALVVESAPDLVCGYHLAIVRPKEKKLLGRFLLRTFQAGAVNQQFQVAATGVTRFGLPKSSIGEACLPLPSRDEQRAIVDFLDRETAKIDTLVAKKGTLTERLKEKRTALISRTVTRSLPPGAARAAGVDPHPKLKPTGIDWLGEVPEHWEVKHLIQLTDQARPIMYGIVLPGPDVPDGVPIVKGGDVKPGRLTLVSLCRTTVEIEAGYIRSRLAAGDIVFSIRGTIGEAELVPKEIAGANLTQDAARVAPSSTTHGPWLLYALKAKAIVNPLLSLSLGAAVRGVNIRDLKRIALVAPPLSEQRAIAAFLDRETVKIDVLVAKIETAIERLQEYRTALITAAVTGKIDVREAAA